MTEGDYRFTLDTSVPSAILRKLPTSERPHLNPLLRTESSFGTNSDESLYVSGQRREKEAKANLLGAGYTNRPVTGVETYMNRSTFGTGRAAPHTIERASSIAPSAATPQSKPRSKHGIIHEPAAGTLASWRRYLPATNTHEQLAAGAQPHQKFEPLNFSRWPHRGPQGASAGKQQNEWTTVNTSVGLVLDKTLPTGGARAKIKHLMEEARQLTERVSETTLAQIEYCMTTIPQPHSAAEVQKRLNKPEFRSRHRTYDEFGIPEGEEDETTSTSTPFITETQTRHRPTTGSEEGSEVLVPRYTSYSEGMDLARRKKENQCALGTHCASAAPDGNKRLHTLDLAPPPRQLAPPRTPYKTSVHVQMPKGQSMGGGFVRKKLSTPQEPKWKDGVQFERTLQMAEASLAEMSQSFKRNEADEREDYSFSLKQKGGTGSRVPRFGKIPGVLRPGIDAPAS